MLRKTLPGCIVRLDFHVMAYKIKNQYVRLTTEIGEVQILARPAAPAISKVKRKFNEQVSARRSGKKARSSAGSSTSPSSTQSSETNKVDAQDPASGAE